ncbi:TPA: hypothetical protein ACH3X1_008823 [Trebouxia sp. C0004]
MAQGAVGCQYHGAIHVPSSHSYKQTSPQLSRKPTRVTDCLLRTARGRQCCSYRVVQHSHIGSFHLQTASRAVHLCPCIGCLAQNRSDGADVPKHDHNSASIPNQPGQVRRPFLKVPWGWKEVASISTLWLLAFWILGYWILPCLLDLAGYERDDLSRRGQALVHLILDVGQLGLTIAILWKRLKAYRPRSLGWFETRLLPIRQWLGPVIVAAASFPLLNIVAQQAQIWFPNDGDLWAQNLEHSILNGDPVSNVLYFAVVTFCAPIWEEAMFRGFFLPSLTKYMPMGAALLLTSAVFAMAHFSLQRLIPLIILGLILGVVYVRTHNLMAPIALHSLWNMYIFWNLLRKGAGIV